MLRLRLGGGPSHLIPAHARRGPFLTRRPPRRVRAIQLAVTPLAIRTSVLAPPAQRAARRPTAWPSARPTGAVAAHARAVARALAQLTLDRRLRRRTEITQQTIAPGSAPALSESCLLRCIQMALSLSSEHWASARRILSHVTTSRKMLWHYTDAAGFHGIVRTNCLRLGDARFLNDRTERQYGISVVMQVIADELRKGQDHFLAVTAHYLKRRETHAV